MIKNKLLLILGLGMLFISCQSDNSGGVNTDSTDIKTQHLENIVSYGVNPQIEKSITAFEMLLQKIKTFKKEENSENLLGIKNSFIQSMLTWKECELYEMGEVKSAYFYRSINNWPANPSRIEKAIDTDEEINQAYVGKLGSPLRSLSAIEYLLYDKNETETLQAFKEQKNRVLYLEATCQEIIEKAKLIKKSWDNYSTKFINSNNAENQFKRGQNQSINAIVALLETIKNIKLGEALGDKSNGYKDDTKLEAYRSELSLEIIKSDLQSIKMMFTGNYPNSQKNIGFDDYLVVLGKKDLVEKVNTSFKDTDDYINSLGNKSLKELIKTNPEKVEKLQEKVRKLLVLFKVDVSSAIGAIITIGDNDGD